MKTTQEKESVACSSTILAWYSSPSWALREKAKSTVLTVSEEKIVARLYTFAEGWNPAFNYCRLKVKELNPWKRRKQLSFRTFVGGSHNVLGSFFWLSPVPHGFLAVPSYVKQETCRKLHSESRNVKKYHEVPQLFCWLHVNSWCSQGWVGKYLCFTGS